MNIKEWINPIWILSGILYYKFVFFTDKHQARYSNSENNIMIWIMVLIDIFFIVGGIVYSIFADAYKKIKECK